MDKLREQMHLEGGQDSHEMRRARKAAVQHMIKKYLRGLSQAVILSVSSSKYKA